LGAGFDARAEFETLFRELNAPLAAFVRRRVPRELVDDVLADTWHVVLRRWSALPVDPSDRRGWIFGVAKKVAARANLDEVRRKQHEGVFDRSASRPDDSFSAFASREAAHALLAALSRAERDVFTLHVLAELSVKETAAELGCSISSVTTRLVRARQHAKEYLAAMSESERVGTR
jgi:RNA polymerase sigma-70 factor (ECF subfamily)